MRKVLIILGGSVLFVMGALCAYGAADEIVLKNGQRIEGDILDVSRTHIMIETDAVGRLSVDKYIVLRYHKKEKEEAEGISAFSRPASKATQSIPVQEDKAAALNAWEQKISLGYGVSEGNRSVKHLVLAWDIDQRQAPATWSGGVEGFFTSEAGGMDQSRISGRARYAWSGSEKSSDYVFVQMAAQRDRPAAVDWRLIPSAGIGYLFGGNSDFQVTTEAGLGYQYTDYRRQKSHDKEWVFVPRFLFEKHLLNKLRFIGETTWHASLEESGDYRAHYEAGIVNGLTDDLAIAIRFFRDYNAAPPAGVKTADDHFVTSWEYQF
jgi:putative salt-induced outer membrane protein YdiY